jgi:hypothetical protein
MTVEDICREFSNPSEVNISMSLTWKPFIRAAYIKETSLPSKKYNKVNERTRKNLEDEQINDNNPVIIKNMEKYESGVIKSYSQAITNTENSGNAPVTYLNINLNSEVQELKSIVRKVASRSDENNGGHNDEKHNLLLMQKSFDEKLKKLENRIDEKMDNQVNVFVEKITNQMTNLFTKLALVLTQSQEENLEKTSERLERFIDAKFSAKDKKQSAGRWIETYFSLRWYYVYFV